MKVKVAIMDQQGYVLSEFWVLDGEAANALIGAEAERAAVRLATKIEDKIRNSFESEDD